MTVQDFATLSALEDAVKLEQFAALVQAQQPASEPWTPVTDYSFEARKQIEGEHPRLIKEVFQPRTVIDVGCGPGHLVRLLRELDVDAEGTDRECQSPVPLVLRDCIRQDNIVESPPGRADLIICREVLEHLTIKEIRRAVTHLCRGARRFVYVTTRFARTPHHLLDVNTSDDLDPTHITLLNQNLLRLLFVLEGFRRRADLETQLDWKQLGRCLVYERA